MNKNKNQTNLTVFGEQTFFEGSLRYTDNLVITGKFKGDIKSTGNLEIAKTATCDVKSIEAKDITIAGNVKGNITAESRIEMFSGSKLQGDITTKKLRSADNVDFKGKITMLDENPNIDIFSVSPEEYKEALQNCGKKEEDEIKTEETEVSEEVEEEK